MVKKLLSQMKYTNNDFFVNIGPKLASGLKHTEKDFFIIIIIF